MLPCTSLGRAGTRGLPRGPCGSAPRRPLPPRAREEGSVSCAQPGHSLRRREKEHVTPPPGSGYCTSGARPGIWATLSTISASSSRGAPPGFPSGRSGAPGKARGGASGCRRKSAADPPRRRPLHRSPDVPGSPLREGLRAFSRRPGEGRSRPGRRPRSRVPGEGRPALSSGPCGRDSEHAIKRKSSGVDRPAAAQQ